MVLLQAEAGPGLISSIVQGLLGIATGQQDVIAAVIQGIQFVQFNAMAADALLLGGVTSLIKTVESVIGSIVSAITHVIDEILHGVLFKLLNEILKLLQKLHDFLAPLIAWLKQLQAIQRQLQMQYLRKIVDLIQRARKILVLFRLLHVGWAKKLDLYLAGLESDIAAKWAKMIRQVNAITGVLDTVLDPRLLLRPGHALASIGGAIGAVQQAVGALGFKQLMCLSGAGPAQPNIEPWAVTRLNFLTDAQSGSGAFADHRAEMYSAINAARADVGEPPLV